MKKRRGCQDEDAKMRTRGRRGGQHTRIYGGEKGEQNEDKTDFAERKEKRKQRREQNRRELGIIVLVI